MLHGTNVLDLTRVLAGPLAAMTLGDLGANVIKVERPGSGDESRGWGPPFDERGESAYYLSCNRNKLGVALDLDRDGDRAVLRDLISGADVVLDNFKAGTMEKYGIPIDDQLAQHSRLIWCTITGFGPTSRRLGYDFVVQAESGWMSITGTTDGEPMKVGVALADVLAGKDAVISVLAGLSSRAKQLSATKRHLFVSLAATAQAALINVAQNSLVTGQPARRWGNAHPNLVPYQLFQAKDRPLVIAVGNDGQWLGCCRALGLEELGADPAVRTNAGRLRDRERVVGVIASLVRTDFAASWCSKLDSQGVPCGLVRTVSEVLAAADASAVSGMPPSVAGSVRFPPPKLDEHGSQIRRLGWGAFG